MLKPTKTVLGVVLGSYGIILGCLWLISWGHLGSFWGGQPKKHKQTLLKSIQTGLGVYVKLKKPTKTLLKPTQTGLEVVLGS